MRPVTLGKKHNKTNISEVIANQNITIYKSTTPISSSTSHSQILRFAKGMTHFAKLEYCFFIYLPTELATVSSIFFQTKTWNELNSNIWIQIPQHTQSSSHSWDLLNPVLLGKHPSLGEQVWRKTRSLPGEREPAWEGDPAPSSKHHSNASETEFQLRHLSWNTSC